MSMHLCIAVLLVIFACILAQDSSIPFLNLEGYMEQTVNGSGVQYNIGREARLLEVYHTGLIPMLSVSARNYGMNNTQTANIVKSKDGVDTLYLLNLTQTPFISANQTGAWIISIQLAPSTTQATVCYIGLSTILVPSYPQYDSPYKMFMGIYLYPIEAFLIILSIIIAIIVILILLYGKRSDGKPLIALQNPAALGEARRKFRRHTFCITAAILISILGILLVIATPWISMKTDICYSCGIAQRLTTGFNSNTCSGGPCFWDLGPLAIQDSYYLLYAVIICMVAGSLIFIGAFIWVTVETFKLIRLRGAQVSFTGSTKFTISTT
jgi:uncharacterized membrane protein